MKINGYAEAEVNQISGLLHNWATLRKLDKGRKVVKISS